MGNLTSACDGGGGDKRHIGELDAVLLLEAGLFPLAQTNDARHVHLVDGVGMGADPHALAHALGDDGAHPGERLRLQRRLRCGQLRVRRRLRRGWPGPCSAR